MFTFLRLRGQLCHLLITKFTAAYTGCPIGSQPFFKFPCLFDICMRNKYISKLCINNPCMLFLKNKLLNTFFKTQKLELGNHYKLPFRWKKAWIMTNGTNFCPTRQMHLSMCLLISRRTYLSLFSKRTWLVVWSFGLINYPRELFSCYYLDHFRFE